MRFGPFEILRPLGRGGMAETFLAVRPGPDGFARHVCVKRVLAERAAEPDFVRSFQREARLAARLVHPHIAQIYEFGCEGETWWMALEHVPGGDLRGLLRALGQPMPLDLGLVLAVDMLEALGYAHELGIVHRDVSPSNILLDLQGNFKLADFGIAKARHVDRPGETAYSTTTGTIKGKAAYMAPEQALGQQVDGRADLWSFGVVLYEAFASAKPFEGPTDLAIMMAANQGRKRPLEEAAPHVPADVCAVVERMLAPSVADRYRSASEVLDALSHRPAPVQGRRRLAAMLKAIGSAPGPEGGGRTEISAPPEPTATATTPSADAPAMPYEHASPSAPAAAPLPAPTRDVTPRSLPAPTDEELAMVPAPPPPQASTPIASSPAIARASLAGAASSTTASSPSVAAVASSGRGLRAALLLGGALVAGIATATAVVTLGPGGGAATPPATLPVSPPPNSSATTPAAPSVDPPMARGVSIPEQIPVTPSADPGLARPSRDPDRAPGSGARPPSARSEAPAPTGTLHVTVIPWGDVSIDGRSFGRSPVTASLRAGSHHVDVRSESGNESREVRVASGEREEIEVDLTD